MSMKLVGFIYLFIYDIFMKSFLAGIFFGANYCNCYYKFELMLRLVMVCRPAKAFSFYSGHPDVCTATIIITSF